MYFTPAALVAIDRWTGGAADNFLFSRLEPDLAPITLTASIDPERIAPPPDFWKKRYPQRDIPDERRALASFRGAALALFLVTLRDFARGRIPLGYGVNRGLGDLDLCTATISGWSDPGPGDHGAAQASAEEGSVRPRDTGGPESGSEASTKDQSSVSDIVLKAKDFDNGEEMKRFQSLQMAWDDYLNSKARH